MKWTFEEIIYYNTVNCSSKACPICKYYSWCTNKNKMKLK